MGRELYANNAASTLATALTVGGLSFDVQPGDGALFPSPTAGDYFFMTLATSPVESNWEIVRIITRTGDTMTIDGAGRGEQGTTAQAWGIGSRCGNRLTADSLSAYFRNDEVIEEVINGPVAIAGGTLTIDFSLGNNHTIDMDQNVTTVVFNNIPAGTKLFPIWLQFVQSGAGNFTVAGWPGSVQWHEGIVEDADQATGARELIAGYTDDGGTNVYLGKAWATA